MNIEVEILKVIKTLSIVDEITSLDENLNVLGFDSLKMVELIIALEDEFGIRLDDSNLNPSNLQTINDLIKIINIQMENKK